MSFEPGDKVLIKTYMHNPDFWDRDRVMFGLMGTTGTVERYVGDGRYRLVGLSWTWRGRDLMLIAGAKLEPNTAFRIKRSKRKV